jgi:calcium-dependent protein kinase
MAPEVLNMEYDEKCDVWSAGVILFTMVMNHLPYDGKNDKDVIK